MIGGDRYQGLWKTLENNCVWGNTSYFFRWSKESEVETSLLLLDASVLVLLQGTSKYSLLVLVLLLLLVVLLRTRTEDNLCSLSHSRQVFLRILPRRELPPRRRTIIVDHTVDQADIMARRTIVIGDALEKKHSCLLLLG